MMFFSFSLEEISFCIFSLSVSRCFIWFCVSIILFFNSFFLFFILLSSFLIVSILEFFLVISIFSPSTSLLSFTWPMLPFSSISLDICSISFLFSCFAALNFQFFHLSCITRYLFLPAYSLIHFFLFLSRQFAALSKKPCFGLYCHSCPCTLTLDPGLF